MYADLILKTPLSERECRARLKERGDQRSFVSVLVPDQSHRVALVTLKGSTFSAMLKDESDKRSAASISARWRFRRSVPGSEVTLEVGQERWQFLLLGFLYLVWAATTLVIIVRFAQTRDG